MLRSSIPVILCILALKFPFLFALNHCLPATSPNACRLFCCDFLHAFAMPAATSANIGEFWSKQSQSSDSHALLSCMSFCRHATSFLAARGVPALAKVLAADHQLPRATRFVLAAVEALLLSCPAAACEALLGWWRPSAEAAALIATQQQNLDDNPLGFEDVDTVRLLLAKLLQGTTCHLAMIALSGE